MDQRLRVPAVSNLYLFLRVFMFAVAVPFLMRLKLSRIASILEPGCEPRPVDPECIRKISAYTEAVAKRGKPLVRPGCLTLGLTRYYFFRRAGMDVSLHFGLGRVDKDNEFVGHCWLTRDGEPYLERRDPRALYIEMYEISRAGGRMSVPAEAFGQSHLIRS